MARAPQSDWRITTAVLALSLAGCAHYAPAPVDLAQSVARLDAAQLAPPSGGIWTGADLLQEAVRRSPAVAESAAKYRASLAAVKVAKAAPPITLTLTAEYAKEAPHWGYGAGADVPLDFGGRRGGRITTAELQALQALYDYGETLWTLRTAIDKARADLATSDAELALAQQAVALRRERGARLQRRVAAGEDDRTLLATAQTELVAAEQRYRDAQARRRLGEAALAKALGVSTAAVTDIRVAPLVEPASLAELPAWRRDAALSRRDVLRAVADYDLAEAALRTEVAKQYPDVHLSPSYFWDHGVGKFPFNLALALPPMDLNRSGIRQAEAARAAAGRTLERTQADALAAVDQAALALAQARDSATSTREKDLPQAERAAAATAQAVAKGEGDRVDDLAAQAGRADVQLAVLDAERTYRAALVDLEDALRRPFDPGETAVLQTAINQPGVAR